MNILNHYIKKYKNLIIEETYDFIVYEMLDDLKEILLKKSTNVSNNYLILETFHNIKKSNNIIERLDNLESILTENSEIGISNIKSKFGEKHDKIIQRDKKWLNSNKVKLLELNYDEIELEVPSDYKITFEQLLNRHNIFDKLFVNSENIDNLDEKLRRFEDKKGNLKNGLDNYFRTGTSRREIGMRKVSGQDAKLVVENMIEFCDSFLSGKSFLEEKMNKIIVDISDSKVKENYSLIDLLQEVSENKNEDNVDNGELKEENNVENKEDSDESPDTEQKQRGVQDRQTGVAVLLSVAEERYFDYINILKGLME